MKPLNAAWGVGQFPEITVPERSKKLEWNCEEHLVGYTVNVGNMTKTPIIGEIKKIGISQTHLNTFSLDCVLEKGFALKMDQIPVESQYIGIDSEKNIVYARIEGSFREKQNLWMLSIEIYPNLSHILLVELDTSKWYGGKSKKGISWFESNGGIFFKSRIFQNRIETPIALDFDSFELLADFKTVNVLENANLPIEEIQNEALNEWNEGIRILIGYCAKNDDGNTVL